MLSNTFSDIKYGKLGTVGKKRGGESLTTVQIMEEEYKDPSLVSRHTNSGIL